MGVQLIKENFSIGHIVHRIGDGIFIGSPYISQMLKFNLSGILIEGAVRLDRNEQLTGYVKAIRENAALFTELANKPDVIKHNIPVFHLAEDEMTLVKSHCEQEGWPNTTHEGVLMFENTFFTCPKNAIKHGIRNAEAGVSIFSRSMKQLKCELEEATIEREKCAVAQDTLEKQLEKLTD